MILRVNDITDTVKRLSGTEQLADYPALSALQEEGVCEFLSPLSQEFSIVREYDHIRVEGAISTKVTMVCARCLTTYPLDLRSSFTIFYSKATADLSQDEEVELSEKELISATYSGDEIDLAPEVAEHVIIELPLKPLCTDACRGLCSICGIDLNSSSCDCTEQKGSLAFSVLKNLKLDR
ncbi:MAG: DUF177 domain-containing protein [Geobacter sp.]|nr:DUF177 domain-containing protein [Geobacter sp.]